MKGARILLWALASAVAATAPVAAQPDPSPAFTVATDHVYTTRERPAVTLTFRRVDHIDFRVYHVRDVAKFFENLRDLHSLGSSKPVVPQERTLIERLALWKERQREEIYSFFRRQFSYGYRVRRRERRERTQVALRQTLHYSAFAQVPLLNPSQLVSSWRELLPPARDVEARRIPLELPGAGLYLIEAVHPPQRAYTIVIVSNLGLVTKAAPGQLLLFTADRFSGKPAAGCQVEVLASRRRVGTGETGADGTFALRFASGKLEDAVALARCGRQIAASDPSGYYFSGGLEDLLGYFYTDKPVYRPGHAVHFKTVLRWRTRGQLRLFDRKSVELVITDPNDKLVSRQTLAVDDFGTVHGDFPVPAGAALGFYTMAISVGDERASGSFQVQEYRKPEFEVRVATAHPFYVQGGTVHATIDARYYFGQPVASAKVRYVLHRAGYYSPLRWRESGEEEGEEEGEEGGGGAFYGGEEESETEAQLDAKGHLEVDLPTTVDRQANDYTLRIEARVIDASNREVAGHTTANVTYGHFLVIPRLDRWIYHAGETARVTVRTVDYTGGPRPAITVNVWLEEIDWTRSGYRSEPVRTTVAQGVVQTDSSGLGAWSLTVPSRGGSYGLHAMALDGRRRLRGERSLWVPGAGAAEWTGEERRVDLIADQKRYQPGDTAHLLLVTDLPSADLLVTKEAEQIFSHQVRHVGANPTIDVPITADDVGGVFVNVAFLNDDHLYNAERRLVVPPVEQRLSISVEADRPTAKPQEGTEFTVTARDSQGRPVRAEVSLGVVDEAVYAVRPDTAGDPVKFFFRRGYNRVGTRFSREYSFIGFSGTQQLLLTARRRPMTLADFKSGRAPMPHVRKDFPDAIFWAATLTTDQDGKARVHVSYPDALTTWRATARAVTAASQLGVAVARTVTTKDLILRMPTPRFLTEGDELHLSTIVHNYLPSDKSATVSMEATRLEHAAFQPATLSVAKDSEAQADWTLRATEVGPATVLGRAVTDQGADALQLTFPVLPYGVKFHTARAGSMAAPVDEVTSELTIPEPANAAARSVRVELAPSLAGSMLAALDFLTSYPYGCTEQTLSSFVPNIMVTRALRDLHVARVAGDQDLDRQVSEGLQRLTDYQHEDGGWGWWKTDETDPFMTAYALSGLSQAAQAGYKGPARMLPRAAGALVQQYAAYPRAVPDLKAYMLYALLLAGRAEASVLAQLERDMNLTEQVDTVWNARDRMSPFGRALLLLALDERHDGRADALSTRLLGEATTKGDLAWWTSEQDPLLSDYNDTSVEATALAVKALVAHDLRRRKSSGPAKSSADESRGSDSRDEELRGASNPLLEKAVRWLLLNRNAGVYWSSTKQTAMVLYGLLDYMIARREAEADFDAEVFVNGTSIGRRHFTVQDLANPGPVRFDATAPVRSGVNQLRILKRGKGVLYWAATAQYFYNGPKLERTGSRRLAIVRQYYKLAPGGVGGRGGSADRIVYRATLFKGQARPGDILLVRLTAAGSVDWRYLMIEDPLPAACEPIEQESLYELEAAPNWWGEWFTRREYHDDRTVFFQERFDRGSYEYHYLLKVVTPGKFQAMPARIEPMYVLWATATSDPQAVQVGVEGKP